MIFRGVEYSPAGADLLRALGRLWRATADPAEKDRLRGEAETIHALHEHFPGLIVHEVGREPKAAADDPLPAVSPEREPASRPATLFDA
jgi:hypothetical protein